MHLNCCCFELHYPICQLSLVIFFTNTHNLHFIRLSGRSPASLLARVEVITWQVRTDNYKVITRKEASLHQWPTGLQGIQLHSTSPLCHRFRSWSACTWTAGLDCNCLPRSLAAASFPQRMYSSVNSFFYLSLTDIRFRLIIVCWAEMNSMHLIENWESLKLSRRSQEIHQCHVQGIAVVCDTREECKTRLDLWGYQYRSCHTDTRLSWLTFLSHYTWG